MWGVALAVFDAAAEHLADQVAGREVNRTDLGPAFVAIFTKAECAPALVERTFHLLLILNAPRRMKEEIPIEGNPLVRMPPLRCQHDIRR